MGEIIIFVSNSFQEVKKKKRVIIESIIIMIGVYLMNFFKKTMLILKRQYKGTGGVPALYLPRETFP